MDWDAEAFERIQKLSEYGRLVHARSPLSGSLQPCAFAIAQTRRDCRVPQWHLYDPALNKFELISNPTPQSIFKTLPMPPLRERKHTFIHKTPEKVILDMEEMADAEMLTLDPNRTTEACWLHPSPKSYGNNVIAKNVYWRQDDRACKLVVQLGLILLFLLHRDDAETFPLTEDQKAGFINNAWELSHLCGNWTCLNPRHFTVEARSVNLARNQCFKLDEECYHDPPCLKHLKRSVDRLRPALFTLDDIDDLPSSDVASPSSQSTQPIHIHLSESET